MKKKLRKQLQINSKASQNSTIKMSRTESKIKEDEAEALKSFRWYEIVNSFEAKFETIFAPSDKKV